MSLVPAGVVAALWLRLEQPRDHPARVAAVVILALAPALVRPLAARAAAGIVAFALAMRVAFGLSPLHVQRLVTGFGSRFSSGFLDFYDVRMPFDPRVHAEMRGVILTAVFGFTLVLGLAVATRRPVAATLVLLLGAGWPATLSGGQGAPAKGIAILLAALLVLGGLTARRVPRVAVPAAAALALAALAASTSSAVAKGGLVAWQRWDFTGTPQTSVSVSYVWDAQYGGLVFPPRRTTVLEIKAPRTSLYWRAALLDVFAGDRWLQGPALSADALEPAAARDRRHWVRQEVTVQALADTHLVGGSIPVAFAAGDAPLQRLEPGVALLPSGLTRGLQYTAWSYAPQPKPAQLARSLPVYPKALVRPNAFLDVWRGVTLPPFGAPKRAHAVNAVLDAHPEIVRYAPLEHAAVAVAGGARSPYAAALALEAWFRVGGGFTYTSRPAVFSAAPLVGFVAQTRAGYCQYFAGAMALMLRYLGVPARVAVGFSSGVYDAKTGVWTVTDHDAHAWVEAWFRGFGWLPFDPTPAAGRPERGRLSAPYSAASRSVASQRRLGGGGPVAVAAPAQAAHRHDEGGAAVSAAASGAAAAAPSSRGHDSLLVLLALVLAATLLGVVGTKLVLRRVRYLSRDPRRVAAACRRELADFLLDQRIDAARSATLHELGALVRDELTVDPAAFVAAATAARFGPPAGAGTAARRARKELRALRRRLRQRLTPFERARGLLSLRSLGFAP
ncbi:MAG: transglutaminase family protein [Gaiellaceae bacterium]